MKVIISDQEMSTPSKFYQSGWNTISLTITRSSVSLSSWQGVDKTHSKHEKALAWKLAEAEIAHIMVKTTGDVQTQIEEGAILVSRIISDNEIEKMIKTPK
jgi:hypothetical protein